MFFEGDTFLGAFTDPDDSTVLVAQGRVLAHRAAGSLNVFYLDSLNRELRRYSVLPSSTSAYYSAIPLRDSTYIIADRYDLKVYRGAERIKQLSFTLSHLDC